MPLQGLRAVIAALVIVHVVFNRPYKRGRGSTLRERCGGCSLSSGGLCFLRPRLCDGAAQLGLDVQFGTLGGAGFGDMLRGLGRLW